MECAQHGNRYINVCCPTCCRETRRKQDRAATICVAKVILFLFPAIILTYSITPSIPPAEALSFKVNAMRTCIALLIMASFEGAWRLMKLAFRKTVKVIT